MIHAIAIAIAGSELSGQAPPYSKWGRDSSSGMSDNGRQVVTIMTKAATNNTIKVDNHSDSIRTMNE
jgi:hypothetical protein